MDSPNQQPPAPIRALVVDDEPPLVRLVTSYLEREGFQVRSAGDQRGCGGAGPYPPLRLLRPPARRRAIESSLSPCGDARAGLKIGLAARRRRDTLALAKAVNEADAGSRLGALHCRLERESPVVVCPCWLPGQPCPLLPGKEDRVEQTEEPVELVERICALDIGKASVMACVRVPTRTSRGVAGRRSVSTPHWRAGCWSWPTGCAARV